MPDAPSTEPRRVRTSRFRRVVRWLLVLAGVFVVLLVLSPFALALPFVRNLVASRASAALGREVHLEKASGFWTSGLELQGIRVASPEGFDEPLATVRRVHLDVNLLGLLSGDVSVHVKVVSPWVTLLQDGRGRRNTEGLLPRQDADAPSSASKPLHLVLEVEDGRVRARGPEGAEEVRDLAARLELSPKGDLAARFSGVAVGAGRGGQDAKIEVDARLPAQGPGPVVVRVPPLDLARLRGLVGAATGVEDLAGDLAATADLRATADGRVSGQATVDGNGLRLTTPGGQPVEVGRLSLALDLLEGGAANAGDASLSLADVVLPKGPISPNGHREKEIVLQVSARRAAGPGADGSAKAGADDAGGATVLRLGRASASFFTLSNVANEAPLEMTVDDAHVHLAGVAAARLDLAGLASAAGGLLGLGPDDRLAGTLTLQARADLRDGAGGVNLGLLGDQLVLPASLGGAGLAPASLTGKANLTMKDDAVDVVVPSLSGLGLDLDGEAHAKGSALLGAHVRARGDLERARSLVGPLLGLEARQRLAGRVTLDADVVPKGGTRAATFDLAIEDLSLTDASGREILREAHAAAKGAIDLADGGGARVTGLHAEALGVLLDAKGGLEETGGARSVDATLTLGGDAGRLGTALARLLGPDYADLRGRGTIDGSLAVQGPLAAGGASLLVNGKLRPGSYSTGGLSLDTPTLEIARKGASDPLAVAVRTGVNGGTLSLDLGLRPGSDKTPWTAHLVARSIDTSSLVTGRGPGRSLLYLVPTILPAGASARVLSGRLDANADLAASDLGGDALTRTVAGKGELHMTDGAIAESTLFRAAAGGLGDVGRALERAVPEVGKELDGLAHAVAFQKLDSWFEVRDQVVYVSNGRLTGDQVVVGFSGRVAFAEQVALEVPVTLLGTPGERLRRVLPSATIPLGVQGTLSSPRVVPGLKAEDLAKGALEGLLGGGKGDKSPLDRLKGLLPK